MGLEIKNTGFYKNNIEPSAKSLMDKLKEKEYDINYSERTTIYYRIYLFFLQYRSKINSAISIFNIKLRLSSPLTNVMDGDQ